MTSLDEREIAAQRTAHRALGVILDHDGLAPVNWSIDQNGWLEGRLSSGRTNGELIASVRVYAQMFGLELFRRPGTNVHGWEHTGLYAEGKVDGARVRVWVPLYQLEPGELRGVVSAR